MAPEILNASPRQPMADIFSLGITIYEVCMPLPPGHTNSYSNAFLVHGSLLPSEGDGWHNLRQGLAEPLPGRPPSLRDLIAACMAPNPDERPTTALILSQPLVQHAGLHGDPTLINAQCMPLPPPFSVVTSFQDLGSLEIDLSEDGNVGIGPESLGMRQRVCTPTNFSGPAFSWVFAHEDMGKN